MVATRVVVECSVSEWARRCTTRAASGLRYVQTSARVAPIAQTVPPPVVDARVVECGVAEWARRCAGPAHAAPAVSTETETELALLPLDNVAEATQTPTGAPPTSPPPKGDTKQPVWECDACGETNKTSRLKCNNCVAVQPVGQLPSGWHAVTDPNSGDTYYYNDFGHTTWERPTEKDAIFAIEAGEEAEAEPVNWDNLLPGWYTAVDEESGDTYCYNDAGEVSWTLPPAA